MSKRNAEKSKQGDFPHPPRRPHPLMGWLATATEGKGRIANWLATEGKE